MSIASLARRIKPFTDPRRIPVANASARYALPGLSLGDIAVEVGAAGYFTLTDFVADVAGSLNGLNIAFMVGPGFTRTIYFWAHIAGQTATTEDADNIHLDLAENATAAQVGAALAAAMTATGIVTATYATGTITYTNVAPNSFAMVSSNTLGLTAATVSAIPATNKQYLVINTAATGTETGWKYLDTILVPTQIDSAIYDGNILPIASKCGDLALPDTFGAITADTGSSGLVGLLFLGSDTYSTSYTALYSRPSTRFPTSYWLWRHSSTNFYISSAIGSTTDAYVCATQTGTFTGQGAFAGKTITLTSGAAATVTAGYSFPTLTTTPKYAHLGSVRIPDGKNITGIKLQGNIEKTAASASLLVTLAAITYPNQNRTTKHAHALLTGTNGTQELSFTLSGLATNVPVFLWLAVWPGDESGTQATSVTIRGFNLKYIRS
ncbi:hypothetical protein CCP3SC15_710003 [Gammaproteobacteria bacterium]